MANPKILNYVYHHCTKHKQGVKCSQKSVRLGDLERQILDYLGTIQIKQKYLDWALEYLKEQNLSQAEVEMSLTQSRQKAYKEATAKLDRLLEMRLNGEIGKEEFAAAKERLAEEKNRCQKLLEGSNESQNSRVEKAESFFEFSRHAAYWFKEATEKKDLLKQRQILATLGSNLTLKDGKLNIDPPEPFTIFKEALVASPAAREMFEPEKTIANKRKKTNLSIDRLSWLGRLDSNQRPAD